MSKLNKSEEIKLVARYLGNMTLLRSYGKRVELSALEIGCKNLDTVLQELKDEAELDRMAQEEHEKRRNEMLAKLQAEGWTLEELLEVSGKRPSSKTKKAPSKYRYVDSKGKECFWSGFGRMPSELQALVEAGQALEMFLIEKEGE